MPRFLDTFGNTTLSIAICDRCKMKRAYSDIRSDGNIPAIRVCGNGCSDDFDPYRLPARQPEKISLRFPRPDADVAEKHDSLITDPGEQNQYDVGIALEQGNTPNNGNLNDLAP